MRKTKIVGDFKVKVIAGTHTVLIAIDCAEKRRHGLLGFAFRREALGAKETGHKWLRSLKVFKSVVPDPRALNAEGKEVRFSTWEHPVQSFLWGDYTTKPDTLYKYSVVPMYGKPGQLEPAQGVVFQVRTEKEFDQGHGVWFNRGSIASQAFAREFGNTGPEPPDNPDPNDPRTKWLSRGLLEACLRYINETPKGDGLRVAAYEFTYRPVLAALKDALRRGVDVRIVYHDTTAPAGGDDEEGEAVAGANEKAIEDAGIPGRYKNRQGASSNSSRSRSSRCGSTK